MKKFIAALLVFSVGCTLLISACGKSETEITETITRGVAEETTISWEEAEVLRAKKLVATKEDFEMLERCVWNIVWASHQNSYDSSSPDAFANAMYMMFNQGVDLLNPVYGKEPVIECFGYFDETAGKFIFEPDPLDKFKDVEGVAGYIKVEAGFVDWVLENVLCVTPDHSKTSYDFDYSSYPNPEEYYYYDGYYYSSVHEGGGGGMPFTTIGFAYNRDGSYTVRFTSFDRESESGYDVQHGMYFGYCIYEAMASLKNVDGERVWSISYLKMVESVDSEG